MFLESIFGQINSRPPNFPRNRKGSFDFWTSKLEGLEVEERCLPVQVQHRFLSGNRQVVLKLFQGPARELVDFHHTDSRPPVDVLRRPEFQQSIDAGVLPNGSGFAILEYFEGQTLKSWLASSTRCDTAELVNVMRLLFKSIWIPLWTSGLRFKDCHSGNFIVKPSLPKLVMIDCEQMRKSAAELLSGKGDWIQRDAHEASAL